MEWGPWIEWKGGALCPVAVGEYVECVCDAAPGAPRCAGRVRFLGGRSWLNTRPYHPHENFLNVTRYRVRKPLGMSELEETLTRQNDEVLA